MTSPHITTVRQALLDTLSDLRSTDRPMDLDRAKAVASVASVLIDSARVEVEYLKATGGDKSEFLLPQVGQPRLTSTGVVSVSPGVTQHRLRG